VEPGAGAKVEGAGPMRASASPVSVQKLFTILVALAVLFAPSAVSAEHIAMIHGHDMQMMEIGHCAMLPSSKTGDHNKADGKSCCISMCMAVALAPSAPADAAEPKHNASYFTVPQFWHGYLGEIATPPPRMA
jgi:hypothetical protein